MSQSTVAWPNGPDRRGRSPARACCPPSAGRSCGTAGQPRVPSEYEGAAVTPAARVIASLAPAVSRVADLKATPLGLVLDTPLPRSGVESAIGNLFTDAMRESVPGADVALHNVVGGLRADFPAGPVTYGRLSEVSPFDNRVVAITLTGAELTRVLARQLQPGPLPARFLVETPRTSNNSVAVSPDGRMVAFVAVAEGTTTRLFVRPIDSR